MDTEQTLRRQVSHLETELRRLSEGAQIALFVLLLTIGVLGIAAFNVRWLLVMLWPVAVAAWWIARRLSRFTPAP